MDKPTSILERMAGEPLTVFYDGDCGVCTWCVRWASARDRYDRLCFRGQTAGGPIPEDLGAADFEALAERTVVAWAPRSGRVWTRHLAVSRVLAALPGGVLLAWPARLPVLGWLFGLAYDAFAARRHRISAALGMGVCGLEER